MKVYLGDGCYATHDGGGAIVLTTSNGIDVTNTIVLELEVMNALFAFYKHALDSRLSATTEAPPPAPEDA